MDNNQPAYDAPEAVAEETVIHEAPSHEDTSHEDLSYEAPSYEAAMPDPAEVERTARRRVRKLYNSASLSLLIQFGIATAISGAISAVYTMVVMIRLAIQNIDMAPDALITLMTEQTMDAILDPTFLLLTTAISYLIANLAAYFLGNLMTRKHHRARLFGGIRMRPLDCVLAVLSVLGIQMLSALVQSVVMEITHISGIDENTAGMLTFSDDILQNILMVVYTVVIAAVTEELLCRGVLLRAFSVKSTAFALFASSLLFGVMHGNFNQMFNGFLLGLVIGYAALKSRSLWLPILLHMCANGHAMLLGFFEYKLGESFALPETVYIIALAIIGVAATVVLFLRNGKPNDETDGFPVTATIEELATVENPRGLTWLTLIKSPAFWIFNVIYFSTAVLLLLSSILSTFA